MKFKMNVQKFMPLLGMAFLSSCYQQELTPDTVKASAAKTEATEDYDKIATELLKYQNGWASLQSTSPSNATWFTDCSEVGKDNISYGKKFRDAITQYHTWVQIERPKLVKSGKIKSNDYTTMPQATSTINNALLAYLDGTKYTYTEKNDVINQVKQKYADWFLKGSGTVSIPKDDNETLIFLRIRQQCFEALQTIVTTAVNKRIPSISSYSTYLLKNITNIKAGMFLYHKTLKHVAGIQKVGKGIDGKPFVVIVESNFSDGKWSTPYGQNPFNRTISIRTSTYKKAGDTNKYNGGDENFKLEDYNIVKINDDNL